MRWSEWLHTSSCLNSTGIVGSKHPRSMNVWILSFFLPFCFGLCKWRSCDGPISRPRSPTTVLQIRFRRNTRNRRPWTAVVRNNATHEEEISSSENRLPWTGSKTWWAILQAPYSFKSAIIIRIWRNRHLIYIRGILLSIYNFWNIVTSILTRFLGLYDLKEIGWYGVDWIELAQDRDQWRALVNTVMNLRVP
jgi:hypothetical protein